MSQQCLALVKDSKTKQLRQCKNFVSAVEEQLCWQHKNKPGIQLVSGATPAQTPAREQSVIPVMPLMPKPILAKPSPDRKPSPKAVVFAAGPPQQRLIPAREGRSPKRAAAPAPINTLATLFLPPTVKDHGREFPPYVTVDGQNHNIPADQTRDSYIPITRPLPNDDPFTQKIGGKSAVLLEGEQWPAGSHFIMQFIDPADGDFVRLFLTGDEDDDPKATLLRTSLNDTRPVRGATEPAGTPHISNRYDQPREIMGWEIHKEVSDDFVEQILKSKEADEEWQELFESVRNELRPKQWRDLKLDGYGDSSQSLQYTPYISNVYNGDIADAGTLHIEDNGSVIMDSA
jgi:hypothetical protein